MEELFYRFLTIAQDLATVKKTSNGWTSIFGKSSAAT